MTTMTFTMRSHSSSIHYLIFEFELIRLKLLFNLFNKSVFKRQLMWKNEVKATTTKIIWGRRCRNKLTSNRPEEEQRKNIVVGNKGNQCDIALGLLLSVSRGWWRPMFGRIPRAALARSIIRAFALSLLPYVETKTTAPALIEKQIFNNTAWNAVWSTYKCRRYNYYYDNSISAGVAGHWNQKQKKMRIFIGAIGEEQIADAVSFFFSSLIFFSFDFVYIYMYEMRNEGEGGGVSVGLRRATCRLSYERR